MGGMVFLPNYFTCAISGVRLTESSARVYKGDVYHVSKVPKDKATVVADNPESLRLKTQSMRQSKVAYQKDFRAQQGQVTAVAGTVGAQNRHSIC